MPVFATRLTSTNFDKVPELLCRLNPFNLVDVARLPFRMTASVGYYGLSLSASGLTGNRYLNIFISSFSGTACVFDDHLYPQKVCFLSKVSPMHFTRRYFRNIESLVAFEMLCRSLTNFENSNRVH